MEETGMQGSGFGVGAQAVALVRRGRAVLEGMEPRQRTKLIACVVVLAAACAVLWWWGSRADWKTLYSGMEERDVQQVETELAAAGIAYQATADGLGVEVPAELLDKARMEVATKGMPQSGRMGFELFDKPNWVGSEFDEKVNYQRALEGELEHTIATIGAVRSARVHLVLSQDSLFTSEQKAAKASVVLKLKRAAMGREEVESIRNLVAGAVEGLTPEQVVLVDADGRVNLNTPGREAAASEQEQQLEQKLVAMLEPLAGRENVRATVNVVYDEASEERTDEVVDPTQFVALTAQKTDEVAGMAARAKGVPGTVSNTPDAAAPGSTVAAAQAANALPVYPASNGASQTQHEENSTYAVSRHTTHQVQGPGRIERITAAVLVNDRAVTGSGKDGATTWRARTPDEMRRLEELAQAAVGFSAKRGDEVVLQNISFAGNAPDVPVGGLRRAGEETESFLRSQPELLKTLGVVLLAVLVVMMVVKPVTKQTMAILADQRALHAGERQYALAAGDGLALGGAGEEQGVQSLSAESRKAETMLAGAGVMEYVATHIRNEPMQSTRLLEAWIGGKEPR